MLFVKIYENFLTKVEMILEIKKIAREREEKQLECRHLTNSVEAK